MSYTAGDVMDLAASLLNDKRKRLYNYDVQLPYLKIAADDLEMELANNDISLTDDVCDINVLAGATNLVLPCDFFLPIKLEERPLSSTNADDFVDMEERDFTPSNRQTDVLQYWAFRNNQVKLLGSTTDRTVRLKFKRTLSALTDYSVVAEVNRAKNYLSFRTAALCAEFIGKDLQRANSLNGQGLDSLDKLTSILVKNRQGVRKRRRPFRVPLFGRISGRF